MAESPPATAPAEENFRRLNGTFYVESCEFGFVSLRYKPDSNWYFFSGAPSCLGNG